MSSHPLRLPLIALLGLFAPSLQADNELSDQCLSLSDTHFEVAISELGYGEGHWEGTLRNRCDQEFDVLIDLQLLDGDGNSVTSYMVVQVVPPNSSERVEKEMHLTSNAAERVEETDYTITGREQPF